MSEIGWYLYGILQGPGQLRDPRPRRRQGLSDQNGSSQPLLSLRGIDPCYSLETIAYQDLIAVTSRVELEAFAPGRGRGTADETAVSWLTTKALAHQLIVERLASCGTIVPARFGMVFHSRPRVQSILEQYYQRLCLLLRHLEGRIEIGVKVFSNTEVLYPYVQKTNLDLQSLLLRVEAADTGRAYLLKRQLERKTEELARQHCLAEIAAIARTLAGAAEENRDLGVTGGVTGMPRLLFNEAYLVARDKATRFRRLIARLQLQRRNTGIQVVVNGPWPPYSFSSLDEVAAGTPTEVAR